MGEKPMLILTLILVGMICGYFWMFGFSPDKWTRYGQYGGLFMCAILVIDNIFRE